jgi:hypothetical protein
MSALAYKRTFRCPCCRAPGGFCPDHLARLGAVRDSIKAESSRVKSVGNGGRKKALAPRCCIIGCFNDRELGEAFCDAHSDQVQETD